MKKTFLQRVVENHTCCYISVNYELSRKCKIYNETLGKLKILYEIFFF